MENAPSPRQFYEGIGIPKGYEHHAVVAAVCASCRASRVLQRPPQGTTLHHPSMVALPLASPNPHSRRDHT